METVLRSQKLISYIKNHIWMSLNKFKGKPHLASLRFTKHFDSRMDKITVPKSHQEEVFV